MVKLGLIKENIGLIQFNLISNMIKISNNSPITKDTANRIIEKFNNLEIDDFMKWLKIVEQKQNNNKKFW